MKRIKQARRIKSGGRPTVSKYRRKQMRQSKTAMGLAFADAHEKARNQAGCSGRESAPARQGGQIHE